MTPDELAGLDRVSALAQREEPTHDGEEAVLGRPLLPARRLEKLLAQRDRQLGSVTGFSDALAAEGLVMTGRAKEALDLAERLLVALEESSPLAPLVLRVQGIALAQLGSFEDALRALELAVHRAREYEDHFEAAQALDALCRLHALSGRDTRYKRDCDALMRSLVLRRLPQPPLPVLPRGAFA